MSRVAAAWQRFWTALRAVTGDDAYERYLAHCRVKHPGAVPLDRAAFYTSELDRHWKQVNRCC